MEFAFRAEQSRAEQSRAEQSRAERLSWLDVLKGIGIILGILTTYYGVSIKCIT